MLSKGYPFPTRRLATSSDSDVELTFPENVSGSDGPEIPDSAFKRSKWFTHDWTLQELIGPLDIVFISASWTPL